MEKRKCFYIIKKWTQTVECYLLSEIHDSIVLIEEKRAIEYKELLKKINKLMDMYEKEIK